MAAKKLQGAEHTNPNLIPMIDIMFLLLLFFMLGADMGHRDLESVRLPKSAEGRITSACSRWLMSAPRMKKSSSRNMMSTIGMRLGATSSLSAGGFFLRLTRHLLRVLNWLQD